MKKSKKMQWVEDYQILKAEVRGRWYRAFHDPETGEYILEAGSDMMPLDYDETHETIKELEASMREVGNLRHWSLSEE